MKKIEGLENVIESIKTRDSDPEARICALEKWYSSQIETIGAKLNETKVQTKEYILL